MNGRALSIDFLRGLAIVGMVLSGQMLWHAELPAWLFHAQVPPPKFVFDPSVAGITWVDLVFPFFLFSMGAAFPLALRRRIEIKGESVKSIIAGIVKRWVLLSFFAIALANLRNGMLTGFAPRVAALIQLAAWICFGALFMRFDKISIRNNRIIGICAAAGLIGLMLLAKYAGGAGVSVEHSDIIIMVLANMSLFGSMAWLLTRGNRLARLAIVAVAAASRVGATVDGSWTQWLWDFAPISWLVRVEYLKYLCIVLPGTIVGDMIWERMNKGSDGGTTDKRCEIATLVLLVSTFAVAMWGLFVRQVTATVIASAVLGCGMLITSRKSREREIVSWGVFWLALGLCFEPFEGGIKKDYATLSYFFVTSGLASFTIAAVEIAVRRTGARFRVLTACGQNPMVAYTAAGFLLMPLLVLTGLAPLLAKMAALSPWAGVLRGVIVTAAVMAVAAVFTHRKWFWRT